jgi:hypothetical protein
MQICWVRILFSIVISIIMKLTVPFHVLISIFKLQGSTNLESVQIIKKPGGSLIDSFLDEG